MAGETDYIAPYLKDGSIPDGATTDTLRDAYIGLDHDPDAPVSAGGAAVIAASVVFDALADSNSDIAEGVVAAAGGGTPTSISGTYGSIDAENNPMTATGVEGVEVLGGNGNITLDAQNGGVYIISGGYSISIDAGALGFITLATSAGGRVTVNGGFQLPDGVTANRPTGSEVAGGVYFDTTLGKLIVHNGSAWVNADGSAL